MNANFPPVAPDRLPSVDVESNEDDLDIENETIVFIKNSHTI